MARAMFLVVLLLAAVAVAPFTAEARDVAADVEEGRSLSADAPASDAPAPGPDATASSPSPSPSDAPSSSSSWTPDRYVPNIKRYTVYYWHEFLS
jgi:hypothetical protein